MARRADLEAAAPLIASGDRRLLDARGDGEGLLASAAGDTYALFALEIEVAVLGQRAADEWPPRCTRWRSAG